MASPEKVPANDAVERMNDADVVAAVLAKFKTTRHGMTATGEVWDEYHEACEPENISRILESLTATRTALAAAAERERVAQAEAAHWQQRWTALCRMHVAASVGLEPSRTDVANAAPMDALTDGATARATRV